MFAVLCEEATIIAISHEAKILTIPLPGNCEAKLARKLTYFTFLQFSDWQKHMGQLILVEYVQNV